MGKHNADVALRQSVARRRGLVMQRFHVDGTSPGVLLEKGGWEHLNLPAIAEKDRIQLSKKRWQERKRDDLLQPTSAWR
jgi:hypothetical protein